MTASSEILCIGSVLWDVIGRAGAVMRVGSDVPGRITRIPGGVAMNIAMTLRRFDLTPTLLTSIGRDEEGDELIRAAERMGMITDYIYRSDDLPTDIYMAVEGANGLIAAIADAHSLEAAGDKILRALQDGRLGSEKSPFSGPVALDGNLTEELLGAIAKDPIFAKADLRIAPASPGKALRLSPLLSCENTTVYLNREEAGYLTQSEPATSQEAAQVLLDQGAKRILVTDGGEPATLAGDHGVISACPPEVLVTRVTGAGDTFMAAHIVAELDGADAEASLERALAAAARYVSGEVPS